jgi:hypothetical protein
MDFIFFVTKLLQLRKMSGLAFIAGKRAQQRGILDPLSSSAVSYNLLRRAISEAQQMSPDEFKASVAMRDNFHNSVVMKFIRQLRPYQASVLNSEADFMEVRRTVKAVLMDELLLGNSKCCIFFTFAHDDANHMDLFKMMYAQKFQDVKVTDESFTDAIDCCPLRQRQGELMSKHPVLSTKYFTMRLYALVHFILNGRSKPLGGIVTDMLQKIEVQRSGGFHGHLMLWLDMRSVLNRIEGTEESNVESLDDLLATDSGRAQFEAYLDKIISGDIPKDPDLSGTEESALNMQSYMDTGLKRRSRDYEIGKSMLLRNDTTRS